MSTVMERLKAMKKAIEDGTYVAPNRRGAAISKCPDIAPCKYCGRVVYAGICCEDSRER